MSTFYFADYGYDSDSQEAFFVYEYEAHTFRETVKFEKVEGQYSDELLERVLFLAFLTVGTSYYKAFPTQDVQFKKGGIDSWQATFCSTVYQDGLSQYAYENNLTREDLATFTATTDAASEPLACNSEGIVCLQSGGKDSLLLARLLEEQGHAYTAWYMRQGDTHPAVLDMLDAPLVRARRSVDTRSLALAARDGAKNGHVPVTFIAMSYALIQAVLLGKSTILTAVGHEGEEPHAHIGDLPVAHQWSKTYRAEVLFAEYVERYISADITIGSPLRTLSELEIARLFVQYGWQSFADVFSSCNVANYQQGADNATLAWCVDCPKCANSFLLFAAFVSYDELTRIFGGDMLANPAMHEVYRGLLGVDDAFKPFECVAEYDELRWAYVEAIKRGYSALPYDVPAPSDGFSPAARHQGRTLMYRQRVLLPAISDEKKVIY